MRKYRVTLYHGGCGGYEIVEVTAGSKEHARILAGSPWVEQIDAEDLGPVRLPFGPQKQSEPTIPNWPAEKLPELFEARGKEINRLRRELRVADETIECLCVELKGSRDTTAQYADTLDKVCNERNALREKAERQLVVDPQGGWITLDALREDLVALRSRNARLEELNREGSALVHSLKTQLTLALQATRNVEDKR